ncbi:MAG TPA: hypothetical protein PLQ81_04895, partial [bacterium]|nr:hypothetical protein [bacterium]
TPVINDFDNDGKMDIIAATEEKIITAITLDSPADYNSVCNSKFMFTLNNTGNNADFSTPLIYEPRNNLIHDTSVTFKWIQMENIIAPKSSYRINGSGYSEPDYVFEKTFGGLLDGEYIFQVEQSFRDKKSMTPAYRKIIIDNKMPCAILDKNINYGGGVINFTGSASDSNFYYYNFKIFTLSGNTVLDTDIFQPVDSGIIYSFNSLNFPDDTYTAELSVFETDSVYFSTDSVSFSFKNDTMKISSNKYSVFTSDNGNLKLDFPLKAADIPLDIVVYKTIASFNGPGLIFVSDKYKIEFDDSLIAKKFMITVKVSESVFAPAIKKALKSSSGVSGDFSILFNNGRDSAWLNLGGYYDSINNTITSSFNRSGIYAAAMNPPVSLEVITSSLSLNKRVIEFDGDEISVLNINGSAEISVFDLNGKLMFSDRTNKWNGKNKNGKKVPAGLYALFCKDNSGVLKKTIYVK